MLLMIVLPSTVRIKLLLLLSYLNEKQRTQNLIMPVLLVKMFFVEVHLHLKFILMKKIAEGFKCLVTVIHKLRDDVFVEVLLKQFWIKVINM